MDFPDPNTDPDEPLPPLEREAGPRSRPARRSGGSRGGGSGSGPRQQLMARRAAALGVGIVVLILLVLGAKGCLDARKNRSLEDYAGNVTQIVDETNALSGGFYGRLEDPQDLGIPDFVSEIESDRSAMDGFLSRVEKLNTPGDMESAQSTLLLVYQLRASAMNKIAERMPTALGDEGKEKAIKTIAGQMEVLSAADVLYNQVTRHQVDNTIANNGASSPEVPRSTFVPDSSWVDPATIEDALGGVSGASSGEADDDLIHGTELTSAAIGGITLDSSVSNTIPAGTGSAVDVSVTNQGEGEETDVQVSISVDGGAAITSSIDTLAVGETGVATVQLTPEPQGEVTLDIEVEPLPGEEVEENNSLSFTVNFE
ncbi:MAG: CARDB domain-containing protein [Solirubrobacterales bacterium]